MTRTAAYDFGRASKKAGSSYLWRAQKIVDRHHKACARGHVDEADARRAREHSSDAPINDGDAWRVGARSEEGKKVAAIPGLQRLSGSGRRGSGLLE